MKVLAIDPGTTKSGWCIVKDGVPTSWGWWENELLATMLHEADDIDHLAIEYVYLRGMKIYQQAVDTVFWVGRFAEAFPGPHTLIDRKDEKMVLCGNATANDTSIKIALIDRFGGRDVAIGGKKCQTCKGKGWKGAGRPVCEECNGDKYETPLGVLHGISGHAWSALAVGVTYLDQQ